MIFLDNGSEATLTPLFLGADYFWAASRKKKEMLLKIIFVVVKVSNCKTNV